MAALNLLLLVGAHTNGTFVCLHGIIGKLFILYVSLSTRMVRVGLMTYIPVLLVMVPPSCCLIYVDTDVHGETSYHKVVMLIVC